MGSVVIGAAIAVQLTNDAGTDTFEAWFEALRIFSVAVPLIAVLFWTVLIFRYVSYLVRLRGWAAIPSRHRIPDYFLAQQPRTRQIVIGLAHPALLLVAGILTGVLGLALIVRSGVI
jgi:hypothetical protein